MLDTTTPAGLLGAAEPVVNADGSVDFHDPAPTSTPLTDVPHEANLAEAMDERALATIVADLLDGIEADIDSNAGMRQMVESAKKLIICKVGERGATPFDGAAMVTHPLLLEALIRFQASSMGELMPAAGPVRMQVNGDSNPDTDARSKRKREWMNYYLTTKDEEYYPDFDQMLLLVGYWGSMFRKVYRDPRKRGMPVSRSLSPEDLIVSYSATSLHSSGRVTHREFPVSRNDMLKMQLKGWYRDVGLTTPYDDAQPHLSNSDGRQPSERTEDATFTLYHCHCEIDLEGLEHRDKDGEPTGLALPYIVTIEPESREILRIARNWNEADSDFEPQEYYAHYKHTPGFGFYGWGLVHLLGSVADALTIMRRQALDTITLKTFPGGLRVKGMRPDESRAAIGPGEFREIDTGGLPIQQAIMMLPYADLPPSFAPVMQELLESGQRLASLGDMAVGEGREDALPGTVIALIEQAVKLESSVLRRLHIAQRKELRLLADLFGADQDAKYPYSVSGQQGQAVAADFADNEDIVPVSDPNIPTQSQRLTQAQGVITLARSSGNIIDMRAAVTEFLQVMGKSDQDITRLMPPPQAGTPSDPVTEFAGLMKGMPLAAGPTQDHAAHIQAHMTQASTPGLSKMPAYQQLIAHMADHAALFYAGEASRLTGIPMTPGQIPPQQEAQITQAVSAASDQLRISLMRLAPPPADDPLAEMKLQIEMAKLQQNDRKMILDAHEQQRKAAQDVADRESDMTKMAATLADNEKQRQTETAVNQDETARSVLALRTAQVSADADVTTQQINRDTTIGEKLIDHASVTKRAAADVEVAHQGVQAERHGADAERHKAAAARTKATADNGGAS